MRHIIVHTHQDPAAGQHRGAQGHDAEPLVRRPLEGAVVEVEAVNVDDRTQNPATFEKAKGGKVCSLRPQSP